MNGVRAWFALVAAAVVIGVIVWSVLTDNGHGFRYCAHHPNSQLAACQHDPGDRNLP